MKKLFFAGIALVAFNAGGSAWAADMLVRPAPPQPPVYNWTGFYVGAHLGAGWGRKQWADVDEFCKFNVACAPLELGSHDAKGLLGGLQAGFNWQAGPVVFGIEAQYSWADLKGDHEDTISFASGTVVGQLSFEQFNQRDRLFTKVDQIGTIAARLGLAAGPQDRTLFYVK